MRAVVELCLQEVLRRADAQVGVVGDLQRAPTRAFGESAPGVRLDAPGDSPEQELLVIGSAGFAEDLAVLVLELADGQVAQALDLFS